MEDLTTPDRMTLRFSPAGLLTAGELRPADSLRYLDEMLAQAHLESDVPSEVAGPFERVKAVHRHGILNYGFFTVAFTEASLLPELALGVRFVAQYPAGVVLVERTSGDRAVLHPNSFRDVVTGLGPSGAYPHRARRGQRSWTVEGHARFDASFNSLLTWARSNGLLDQWLGDRWRRNEDRIKYAAVTRSRPETAVPDDWNAMSDSEQAAWWVAFRHRWEDRELDVVRDLRNLAAHPTYHQIVTPVDSGRAIIEAAALINSLWVAGASP